MIDTRQAVSATLKDYRGASTEDKPTDCAAGSTYYEWDTYNLYMFNGEEWLMQGSGGGGGGTSFGAPAPFALCAVSGGVPDTSSPAGGQFVLYASESDVADNKCIVAGVIVDLNAMDFPWIGSGVFVGFQPDSNAQIPDTATAKLYIYNSDTQALTEVADALTSYTESGYYYAFEFTMPEVTDPNYDIVIIGIEGDEPPTE